MYYNILAQQNADTISDILVHESENADAYLNLFYEKYQSRFVNQYASTDPVEDIAESWTAFVSRPTPSGNSVAEQKIKFFSQFPESIELRYQFIKSICTYECHNPGRLASVLG